MNRSDPDSQRFVALHCVLNHQGHGKGDDERSMVEKKIKKMRMILRLNAIRRMMKDKKKAVGMMKKVVWMVRKYVNGDK